MKRLMLLVCLVLGGWVGTVEAQPLVQCANNPRYFCKDGAPVLLTGSHTWLNLYDQGGIPPFDYAAYLDFLEANNHSFVRMWSISQGEFNNNGFAGSNIIGPVFPFLRPGPGLAGDGRPKFDLTLLDTGFFERLYTRVAAAQARGIYVSLMLFEGWELQFDSGNWQSHPFSSSGNINGVNADTNGDGKGTEAHTATSGPVFNFQKAYVARVLDTLNGLDNVLYEIANESGGFSTAWQYAMIDFIHQYEGSLPKQHPVGMTFQWQGGTNANLYASPADWIAPATISGVDNVGNPPVSTGQKVVVYDTDHNEPFTKNGPVPMWRNFLRGNNPIYMDGYDSSYADSSFPAEPSVRNALGKIREYSERVNLLGVTPQNGLASSGYCLCSADEYLTLALTSGNGNKKKTQVTLNLSAGDTFAVEWLNLTTNTVIAGPNVNGGAAVPFTAPSQTAHVLFVHRTESEPPDPPDPPAIGFYRAINLGGTATVIDGNAWEGNSAANYSFNGNAFCNQNITLNPPTDAARAAMIRCSVYSSQQGSNAMLLAVPPGTYDVFLYVWEDNNNVVRNVLLEGQIVQASVSSGTAGHWQKLGPFRATINDGSINITTSPTGDPLNLSGLEVWRVN